MISNRTKRTVGKANIPEYINPEKRDFNSCCEPFLTLASLTEGDRYYNDANLVLQKLYSEDDSATFTLIKDGNEIVPIGVSVSFTGDQLVAGFVIEWREHLAQTGPGCYDVRINYSINGVEGDRIYRRFDLQHWTIHTSEESVRILSIYDDYSRLLGIDFSNSGCFDTIRFTGMFGKMLPNFEVKNHTSTGFLKRKVENETSPTYELNIFPTSECYTERILFEHLLHANEIYISDHNASNHNKSKFRDIPVILKQGTTPEPEYPDGSDYAAIKALFEDRVNVSASHFNGKLSTNNKVILEMLAGTGGEIPTCDPAEIRLNGDPFLTVPSGGYENITLLNQDGEVFFPDSIDGSTLTITTGATPITPGIRVPVNTITDPDTQILWTDQVNVTTGTGVIQKTSGGTSYNADASCEIQTLGDFALRWRFGDNSNSLFGISFINFDSSFERVEYSLSAQDSSGGLIYALTNGQAPYTLNGIPDASVAIAEIRVIGSEVQFWWDGDYMFTWPKLLPSQHGYMTFDISMLQLGTVFTEIEVEYF